jgi:hypothetical protein
MKNLTISLSLILMLTAGQTALADMAETASHPESGIETIVVTAMPEVANFEIYSEKHSVQALEKMMNYVIADLNNENAEEARSASTNNLSI